MDGIFLQKMLNCGVQHQDSKEELAALHKLCREQFKPVGVLEEMLVEKIVHAQWRLRRVMAADSGELVLKKIASYGSMLRQQLHDATTHLAEIQRDRQKEELKALSNKQSKLENPKAKISNPAIISPNAAGLPLLKNLEEVMLIPFEG